MISGDFNRKDRCYCDDYWNIENYDKAIADTEHTWICHHRLEIDENGNEVKASVLKEKGLLYHRPASELIFVTAKEHAAIHDFAKKMKHDMKGKNNPMFGKHHSKKTKERMSDIMKDKNYMHGEHGYFVKGARYDH
jgi:hypothetical protein